MPNGIIGAVTSALGGPLTSVMEAAGAVIGKFIPDANARIEAQRELIRMEQDFRMKMLEADVSIAQQQAAVITSEAKSESWLARNWRPILMLTFTFIIAWNFIVSPLFHVDKTDIPPDMWELLRLGITGYIAGRSLEKIAPAVADAIRKKDDA